MAQVTRMTVCADDTGTLELVCERPQTGRPEPEVRAFFGTDEFGLLVDDLDPNERVTLFFEADSPDPTDADGVDPSGT